MAAVAGCRYHAVLPPKPHASQGDRPHGPRKACAGWEPDSAPSGPALAIRTTVLNVPPWSHPPGSCGGLMYVHGRSIVVWCAYDLDAFVSERDGVDPAIPDVD